MIVSSFKSSAEMRMRPQTAAQEKPRRKDGARNVEPGRERKCSYADFRGRPLLYGRLGTGRPCISYQRR